MYKRVKPLGLVLLICVCGCTGELPRGYTREPVRSLPDSLHEVLANGRGRIVIRRQVHRLHDLQLIETAESLYPPKELVQRFAGGRVQPVARESAKAPQWWYSEFDGFLLPVALTAPAVWHYVDRVREVVAPIQPPQRLEQDVAPSASVTYEAQVKRRLSVIAPSEVVLRVHVTMYCGNLCALNFTHTRHVFFNIRGAPIKVVGDEPASVVVS